MKVSLQEFLENVPSRVKSTRRCFKVRTLHNQKQDGFGGVISTGLGHTIIIGLYLISAHCHLKRQTQAGGAAGVSNSRIPSGIQDALCIVRLSLGTC